MGKALTEKECKRNEKELKALMVEFDMKRKKAEEVGKIDEGQLKTIVTAMLDDETRRHTVAAQRADIRI